MVMSGTCVPCDYAPSVSIIPVQWFMRHFANRQMVLTPADNAKLFINFVVQSFACEVCAEH